MMFGTSLYFKGAMTYIAHVLLETIVIDAAKSQSQHFEH